MTAIDSLILFILYLAISISSFIWNVCVRPFSPWSDVKNKSNLKSCLYSADLDCNPYFLNIQFIVNILLFAINNSEVGALKPT